MTAVTQHPTNKKPEMISSESHESRTEAVYARRHSDRAPGASLHNIFTAAAPAAALTTPQEPHHG